LFKFTEYHFTFTDYMKTYNSFAPADKFSLKILALILLFSGLTFSDIFAQRGNNHIAIGAEWGPVVTNYWNGYKTQVGLPIKAYYGTGNNGQWMIRSGVHNMRIPSGDLVQPDQRVTGYTVPLAFGYRQNIKNWYLEGSFGMAWERQILDFGSPDLGVDTSTRYPINFGAEVGYQINNFDLGLSLQNNLIRDRDETEFMVLVGLKAMYRFGF